MFETVDLNPFTDAMKAIGPYLDALEQIYRRQSDEKLAGTQECYFKLKKAQLDLLDLFSDVVDYLDPESVV